MALRIGSNLRFGIYHFWYLPIRIWWRKIFYLGRVEYKGIHSLYLGPFHFLWNTWEFNDDGTRKIRND